MDRKDLRYGRPYRMLGDVMSFKKGDIVYYCGYLYRGENRGRIFHKECLFKKGPGFLSKRQWHSSGLNVWLVLPWELEKVSKRELKGK